MESMFNGLIQFQNTKQFETYLNSIDKNDAWKLIELAILYAQKNGLFSLEESHCIYLCINKIKENKNGAQQTENESL